MGIKDKRKWLAAVLICLAVWALCGCTGGRKMSIDTSLEIDENFRGHRVMSAVVPKNILNEVFHGSLEELQNFVTEKCPSTLICSAEEGEKGVHMTMTLDFVSLKDYTNKIGQILGKTPGIYYDASKSVFKNGYMIQENFSSLDLYGWLLEALKASNSLFEGRQLSDIFTNGTTQVVYSGEVIETNEQIHVEQMDSKAFDSLSVELTMNDDGTFKAEINFIASHEIYYEMGDEMDSEIKKLMPDGGVYDVTDVDTQRVYSIGFSAYNRETLLSQLNSVLKTKNCKFEMEEKGDMTDPFQANRVLRLYLDGSYFLDFSKPQTELIYKLNVGSNYGFSSCKSLTGFLKDYSYEHTDPYTSIYATVGPSDEIEILLTYAIDMKGIDVYTKINGENDIERTFGFQFDSEKAALIGENFETKLRSRMAEGMSLETSRSEGRTTYHVHFQGSSPEEISLMTSQFLDGNVEEAMPASQLVGGKSKKKNLRIRSYAYEDRIDMTGFLGNAAVEEGITYRMEYPRGYTAAFEEHLHTGMITEGNTITCQTRDPMLSVQSKGETANMAGITQIILWWGSFVVTLISVILNLRHIAGYIRQREKYLLKTDLFHGRNLLLMTIGIVALMIFLFTSLRLILRIY